MSLFQGRRTTASAAIRISPPRARTEELVVEELDGELLVYDRTSQRAHCLGAPAARVWRACDGVATVDAIATSLGMEVETVDRALAELERIELLDSGGLLQVINGASSDQIGHANGNGKSNGNGLTRRDFGKRSAQVGGVAFAAPMILSVAAPTPAAAATVIPFQCEVYTVKSCGTSDACGHINGCCCCCQGGGNCKTCGATAFCALGTQPCNPTQGGGFGTHCSSVGGTPASPSGCCGVTGAQLCGCGFGPNANCCTPTTGAACPPTTGTTTCFPCCAGKQLTSAAALGCCTSPTVNCCDPVVIAANPCCAQSTINTDCCVTPAPACCATNSCP